jgi:acetyltransferase
VNLLRRIQDHVRSVRLQDGRRVFVRPLRDSDLAHAQQFFAGLSDHSRYLRFMMPAPQLTEETLARLLEAMHATRSAVIVAIVDHGHSEELVGGLRVVPAGRRGVCEFALTIVDAWQGRGLGTRLLAEAVRVARTLGYRRIEGSVLSINAKMLKVAQRQHFELHTDPGAPGVTNVSRRLRP